MEILARYWLVRRRDGADRRKRALFAEANHGAERAGRVRTGLRHVPSRAGPALLQSALLRGAQMATNSLGRPGWAGRRAQTPTQSP